ncbi:hypothetical protein HY572_03950 [Candidatus Micrarchaeota archaeon]|nr:hypothetical protein [Candidatus Micrarchaeota archaeon]
MQRRLRRLFALRPLGSRACFRGQGAVEYLFVIVFLVGFIVAVLVPSVRQAEISVALSSARQGFLDASSPDARLLSLNYSVQEDTVWLDPQVINRSTGGPLALSAVLSAGMLDGVQKLSPSQTRNESCAFTSNFAYCLVGSS